jgi:spermidine synthase
MHLLTREAFRVYARHLKPDGVLAVHISNRYLDLKPVVASGMAEMGWRGLVVEDNGADQPYYTGTTWVVLSADDKLLGSKFFESDSNSLIQPLVPKPGFAGWTDDFSNIISIMK